MADQFGSEEGVPVDSSLEALWLFLGAVGFASMLTAIAVSGTPHGCAALAREAQVEYKWSISTGCLLHAGEGKFVQSEALVSILRR